MDAPDIDNDFIYSKNWREDTFAFGSLPFFDVMADGEYLYLLKMPKWKREGTKENAILGLSVVLGPVIAYAIGDTRKRKYYEKLRSTWISSHQKLLSKEFERYVFMKVPLIQLKKFVALKKDKFKVSFDGKKITLLRKATSMKMQSIDPEFKRMEQYFVTQGIYG